MEINPYITNEQRILNDRFSKVDLPFIENGLPTLDDRYG